MALTKLSKHDKCEVEARLRHKGPHYAELHCKDCDVHIQWLTWWDFIKIQDIIGGKTYRERKAYRQANGIKERSVRV